MIPSCKLINQTRKAPLDIFALLLEIRVAYYPVINIRPFIREKSKSWGSILTKHEVRNIVTGASQLIATASFGKN